MHIANVVQRTQDTMHTFATDVFNTDLMIANIVILTCT